MWSLRVSKTVCRLEQEQWTVNWGPILGSGQWESSNNCMLIFQFQFNLFIYFILLCTKVQYWEACYLPLDCSKNPTYARTDWKNDDCTHNCSRCLYLKTKRALSSLLLLILLINHLTCVCVFIYLLCLCINFSLELNMSSEYLLSLIFIVLYFQDLSLVDAGAYTCTATSRLGTVEATGFLIVRSEGKIIPLCSIIIFILALFIYFLYLKITIF